MYYRTLTGIAAHTEEPRGPLVEFTTNYMRFYEEFVGRSSLGDSGIKFN